MDDLKRYLIEETVEDFGQGRVTRRDALATLAGLTGLAMATQLLAACGGSGAAARSTLGAKPPLVAVDDPELVAAAVTFDGDGATLSGYLARPAQASAAPIVLVCHENRGLTAHIEDVTRRLAKAGYLGLAVDLLSREGGTAKFGYDDVPGVLGNAAPERHVGDLLAGLAFARTQRAARADRVGMTGFCFGGGLTWRVAAALPDLRAAVPFYGMPIDIAEVPTIEAAVLGIYAERDDRITSAVPPVEAAMLEHGKTFRKIVYAGTEHAFHNDTRERYDANAAKAAWRETLAWFARYLA